jgi:hypothetical protein
MKKTGTEINKIMNNLNIKNLIVSERWQSSSDYTGLGSYWTWTGESVKAISNEYPAKVTSRAYYFSGVSMRKKSNWLVFGIMVLYLTFFGLISISYGADEEPEIMTETKTISGVVGGISPKVISISLQSEEKGVEYEQALRIGDEVKLVRIDDYKSIAPGDTVSVEYAESTQEYEETQADGSVETKTKIVDRVATKITFLRPASDTLRSER